tara:strand:+ start:698 stop:1018 length:321 start_codon:yes stop_codon:yes gene_type:complete
MSDYKVCDNGVIREATAEEIAQIKKDGQEWTDNQPAEKLKEIRHIRLQKLQETDYLAMSDNVLNDDMKNFRKSMRDIPQDYDSSKYDELLARDSDGKLTHSVWSKP